MDTAVLWAMITAVWASVCLSAFFSVLQRRALARRRRDRAPAKSAVLGPTPSTSRAGVSKASRRSAAVRMVGRDLLESGPTTALARPSPSNPSTSRAGVSKASRLSATVRVVGDAESRTGGSSTRSLPEAGSQARAEAKRVHKGEKVDEKGKWSGRRVQPSAFDLQPELATPSLPPQKQVDSEAKGLGVNSAGQKGSIDTSVLKRHSKSDTSVIYRRHTGRNHPAAMTPDTRLKGVPKEFTCSWEEGLPFGPLRRPAPVPRPTMPRTRSFERMIANDRQAPPTPPGHRRHVHSSGSLFYTNVIEREREREIY